MGIGQFSIPVFSECYPSDLFCTEYESHDEKQCEDQNRKNNLRVNGCSVSFGSHNAFGRGSHVQAYNFVIKPSFLTNVSCVLSGKDLFDVEWKWYQLLVYTRISSLDNFLCPFT